MMKASNILAALAICFGVAVAIALPIQLYLANQHCQYDSEGDAWRAAQERKTGVDPCEMDRPPAISEIALPSLFIIFTAAALISRGLLLVQDRRKEVIKELN